jgi:hypothetical protein
MSLELHIHDISQLPFMLWSIVELKLGQRAPRLREGAHSVGEKVVHALLRYGILIYFKKF